MEEQSDKKQKIPSALVLPMVQSVVCAVVILIVLMIRLVSGDLFAELGAYFHRAMQENALADAVDALWGDVMEYEVTEDPAAESHA